MRQRVNNQKLNNWHRPIPKNRLKTAYLRSELRSVRARGRVSLEEEGQLQRCSSCGDILEKNKKDESLACRWCVYRASLQTWDEDGLDEEGQDQFHTRPDYRLEFNMRNVLRELAFSSQIQLPLELVDAALENIARDSSVSGKWINEEKLAGYFKDLVQHWNKGISTGRVGPIELERLKEALGRVALPRLSAERPLEQGDYAVGLLALFSGYRTRGLTSWRRPSEGRQTGVSQLARHLFCQYPVPAWMDAVWEEPITHLGQLQRSLKWACWFVCVGGGGSLQKLTKEFGYKVGSQTLRHIYNAPADLKPMQACQWAEAFALSGSKRVADWMLRNHGYWIDPTSPPETPQTTLFSKFWAQTVRWLARFERELADAHVDELLEWGLLRTHAALYENSAPFSWAGRTPRRCLAEAAAYLEVAMRKLGDTCNQRWAAVGLGWVLAENDPAQGAADLWVFEELTQGAHLWEEGVAMRHCVAGFDQKCANGGAHIVSLKRNGDRALTIELTSRSLSLVQAKGRFNRAPIAAELRAVEQWLTQVVGVVRRSSRT